MIKSEVNSNMFPSTPARWSRKHLILTMFHSFCAEESHVISFESIWISQTFHGEEFYVISFLFFSLFALHVWFMRMDVLCLYRFNHVSMTDIDVLGCWLLTFCHSTTKILAGKYRICSWPSTSFSYLSVWSAGWISSSLTWQILF